MEASLETRQANWGLISAAPAALLANEVRVGSRTSDRVSEPSRGTAYASPSLPT
jgi:hypothetical protein